LAYGQNNEDNSTDATLQCLIASNRVPNNFECFYFDSWTRLNQLIIGKNATNIAKIYLKPKSRFILTSEFDLENLVSIDLDQSDSSLEVQINFFGLKGITIQPWPQNQSELFEQFDSNLVMFIYFSLIEFYFNEQHASELDCTRGLISENETTFFNYFKQILFAPNTQYSSTPVCPYMFSNSILNSLNLYRLEDSLVQRNLWTFRNTARDDESTINSSILELLLGGYKYVLDDQILNWLVFERLIHFQILHSVGSIQPDLFKSFAYLLNVLVQMDSLRNILFDSKCHNNILKL
jgi:hypothetical protein